MRRGDRRGRRGYFVPSRVPRSGCGPMPPNRPRSRRSVGRRAGACRADGVRDAGVGDAASGRRVRGRAVRGTVQRVAGRPDPRGRYGRTLSSVAVPIPLTCRNSSTERNGPFARRWSSIRFARPGPIPGTCSSSSAIGAVKVGEGRRDCLSGPGAEAVAVAAKCEQAEEHGNDDAERKLSAALCGGRSCRRWRLGGWCVHDGDRAVGPGTRDNLIGPRG